VRSTIIIVLLWVASVAVHNLVVPFPPWAQPAAEVAFLLQMIFYAIGSATQMTSLILPRMDLPSRWLHHVSLGVFFFGGVALFALGGRPDVLGSMWGIYLLIRVLRRAG